jgi:hypothetical protein
MKYMLGVIHLTLRELATKFLPQYEADDGSLTVFQLSQIQQSVPKAKGGTVRSSFQGGQDVTRTQR